MEQALPEMIQASLRARGSTTQVLHPILPLAGGLDHPRLIAPLSRALEQAGLPTAGLARALRAAAEAQRRYDARLAEIGRRTLDYGRRHDVPVVAVCGPLHVIHDPVVGAGVPRMLRDHGVLALPQDCWDLGSPDPPAPPMADIHWAEARHALRVAVATRARGRVYPLLLSAFGCGPASFVEQVFDALLEGHPHTALESDGHGGAAGYITRIQAFLHTVREHGGEPGAPPAHRLELVDPPPPAPLQEAAAGRELVLLSMGDRLSPILAATYRAHGFQATAAPPPDPRSFVQGRRDCSGKECLPYQLIWSGFRAHLQQKNGSGRALLMQASGQGMCRNCMFATKDRLSIERMGLEDRVSVRHLEAHSELGTSFLMRMWAGMVTWDLLLQLASYHRSTESEPGTCDRLFSDLCAELEQRVSIPGRPGLRRALALTTLLRDLRRLVARASEAFAGTADAHRPPDDLRTVLLSGDIYLRVDPFANDDLIRRLNTRGIRVLVEPMGMLTEYMAHEGLAELMGLPTKPLPRTVVRLGLAPIRKLLYSAANPKNPWLPRTDIPALLRVSRELLDRYPQGEAPVTIGSVLHHFRQHLCDGAVIISPWGCAPALASEALLRHQRQIPALYLYGDGTPIEDRRLEAFAFRLRQAPSRVA